MKCDELKEYYYYEDRVVTPATHMYRVYHADKVDALLAAKDKEIAELKKKCEAEKSIGATFSENGAELARWVEELRKEIESLKASHYAEMVDAGMRERRLTFKNPRIRIGTGRPEWGAELGKNYFVITWEA